jgi:hypothetical protein
MTDTSQTSPALALAASHCQPGLVSDPSMRLRCFQGNCAAEPNPDYKNNLLK